MNKPIVSIVCITYNHEKFIESALKGFVSQKTSFPIEIIVFDDGSTDNTQRIIKRFSTEYPGLFKTRLRRKNVGVGINLRDALMSAKGDYIATCEGDDFWIDNSKLQRQIEFLENNKDYALCFHETKVIFEDDDRQSYKIPVEGMRDFSLNNLIRGNYIHTSSVVYRKNNYKNLPINMLPIDWYLNLQHAKVGKIGFLDRTMSVYRRNKNSVWFPEKGKIDEFWVKQGFKHAMMFERMHDLFRGTEYQTHAEESQDRWTEYLLEIDARLGSKMIEQLCVSAPAAVSRYMIKNYLRSNETSAGNTMPTVRSEDKNNLRYRLRHYLARFFSKG